MSALHEPAVVALGQAALDPAQYGRKASWLAAARAAGEPVPDGFCIAASTALAITAGDHHARAALQAGLAALQQGGDLRLAVRASPALSLPGALRTLLDVPAALEPLCTAIAQVIGSREAPAVQAQLAARGKALPDLPWLGVLVQRYVPVADPGHDFGAVVWSRDVASGSPGARGEWSSAGVPDVVSGRARPLPLEPRAGAPEADTLALRAPAAFAQLAKLAARLDNQFAQPVELELGFVAGQPWLLQVRPLLLSPRALVKAALDAVDEDAPNYALFVRQLARSGLRGLCEQQLSTEQEPLLRGVPASMGVAVGVVVTDVERAIERAAREPVVLLRPDAIPEDVAAFRASQAVVTTSGGLTCHAAVIARGLGIPAVVGVGGARIDLAGRKVWGGRDGAHVLLNEGDMVTVDARRGMLYRGALPFAPRIQDAELRRLFAELRKLRPTPLWVEGEAHAALALKEDVTLDGALCTMPADGALPPGRGRECWIQLSASELAERLPTLPPGWGVVVTGALKELAGLRRRAPLRAFGVRLERPDDLREVPETLLDLVVLGSGFAPTSTDPAGLPPPVQLRAARVLRVLTDPEGAGVPDGDNVGWVVPAADATIAALRYATRRFSSHDAHAPARLLSWNSLADGEEP